MKQRLKQHANTSASGAGGNGKLQSLKKKHASLEAKIHELTAHGKRFQDISGFCDRVDIMLVWPEIREMCAHMAVTCLNIRNMLIEEHDRKHG